MRKNIVKILFRKKDDMIGQINVRKIIVRILFCKKHNMIGGNSKRKDLIGGRISKHGSGVHIEKEHVHAQRNYIPIV